jgi:hypothetical protein
MFNAKGKRKDDILWKDEKESGTIGNECESVSKWTKMRIVKSVNLRQIAGMVKSYRLEELNTGQWLQERKTFIIFHLFICGTSMKLTQEIIPFCANIFLCVESLYIWQHILFG